MLGGRRWGAAGGEPRTRWGAGGWVSHLPGRATRESKCLKPVCPGFGVVELDKPPSSEDV
ncbi:hypothetical protein E2562_025467 [Oryza meyeriana var. granulata]|uniref:Uncharacterized protein n=1 Tax=Oryza meyeriana var. granulata TaxID=110450 RepID=A0A6G1D6S8_9ORYZ|nr:hypothetical protein E2562_025467 [Oryza meyeriana var. granulata]